MIDSSNAYKKLKLQIQDSMDVLLLVCHAVPALNAYIKAVEHNSAPKLPDPHFFVTPAPSERLKTIIPKYRKNMGKLVFLNSFSYFEAYIEDLVKEFFEFHGGEKNFLDRATQRRAAAFDAKYDPLVKKLREPMKKEKDAKYKKIRKQLINDGYYFPIEIFSVYGVMRTQERLKDLKAAQIPDFLSDVFGLTLSTDELDQYSKIRDFRNGMAHGKIKEVDLEKAIEFNEFIRNLAIKIDNHVVKYFFVIDIV